MSKNPVRMILMIIAYLALVVCFILPVLVFTGTIPFTTYILFFNIFTLVYFISAPFSFGK